MVASYQNAVTGSPGPFSKAVFRNLPLRAPSKSGRVVRAFVSYSRHENQSEKIAAFAKWLEDISEGELELVLDNRMRSGDSIPDFENSIKQFGSVVVIGTEIYKQKVESGDFGVARENLIISSLNEQRLINVFLAVMEQTVERVFPENLHGPLANDFVGVYHDVNTKSIPPNIRTKYNDVAKGLVSAILASHERKRRPKADVDELRKRLFFELKHESISSDLSDDLLQKIFVKTSFYKAVEDRSAYLLIGRKGSGKSFLTEWFTRNPKIFGTIPVNIHLKEFKLMNIYNMRSTARIRGDIGKIISQRDIFEAAWVVAFVTAAMAHLYLGVRTGEISFNYHELNAVHEFLVGAGFIEATTPDSVWEFSSQHLIDWCTEKIFHYIDVGIRSLEGDYASAVAKIPSFVDPAKLVRSVIGQTALRQYQRLAAHSDPRFLITVDGFDTKFDTFRRDTNALAYTDSDKQDRVAFEIDWLSGLVEATQRLVIRSRSGAIPTSEHVSIGFLVTLPRDRFAEVQRNDRDSFRMRFKHVEIRWSGIELMNLVRKRLEIYFGKEVSRGSVDERFSEAIGWIGGLPQTIRFSLHGRDVFIEIFMYILRHSFWRPRDIIYHIAELIILGEQSKRYSRAVSTEALRRHIRDASREIINSEFIGEFISIFPSIEQCLECFRKSPIEMDFEAIRAIVRNLPFRLSSGEFLVEDIERIDFLYEIGFIGIVLGEEERAGVGFFRREAFSFSDSIEIYRGLHRDSKLIARWAIHPIFSEYLQLETKNAPFLLHYDLNYLFAGD